MHNEGTLESTSNLVAHLLREIESVLRSALRPLATEAPDHNADARCRKEDQKESQKEQIRAILQALGIPEDTPEAHAWCKLAGKLHCFAHRSGLGAPRSTREISELWDRSQTLLDVLLQSLREHFLAWIRMLDGLLAKRKPNKEDRKRLTQEIPNNAVTHGYFFDRLDKPEWLECLGKNGFFTEETPYRPIL